MTRLLLLPWLLTASLATAATPAAGQAEYAVLEPARLTLSAVDVAALEAEDARRDAAPGTPRRHGVLQVVAGGAPTLEQGQWRRRKDGEWQWQLRIEAVHADALALGFSSLRLPAGARLQLAPGDGSPPLQLRDADNPRDGVYHSPLLPGTRATLTLTVAAAQRPHLRLQLAHVVHGYRSPFQRGTGGAHAKSGSCNIDVVCPQGEDYRDQIASSALYTFNSGGSAFSCSGTLIATGDRALDLAEPRFATAHHCVDNATEVQSMVFYWGYESPSCRAPGSAASGTPLPRSANTRATQSGATLLATHAATDFTVVELSDPVPAAARAFYSGWDRSGSAPPASVGIHHPDGDEKRITFNSDPLTTMASCILSGTPASTHWRIAQYEAGTTEPGSSGSGLWADARDEGAGDAEDERFIGVLSGGEASCTSPGEFDCYGRLSQAWDGGGSAASRMRDWFDRTGTNPTALAGMQVCDAPALTLDSPAFASPPTAGDTVSFSVGGASGPRTYRWDIDGDGVFDREGSANTLQVVYPRALSAQVRVQVDDGSGCNASVSRALDVRGPVLTASAGAPQPLCGDGDGALEAGERWALPVTLRNTGSAPWPAGGRALFARQSVAPAALATADLNGNGFGPYDDARTVEPIALGGGGLRLYGQTYAQAFMSTNGYVAFNPAESGADWSNGCNGGVDNGATGPQLRPLHDDLRVADELDGAGLRYAWFATCPRPPQSAPAQQGCHVFQWSRMRWVDSASGDLPASGDATFQALVYQPSGQIVYQTLAADPHAGGQATLGVVSATGDALDLACNQAAAAPSGRAWCVFDPQSPPSGGFPAGSVGPNAFGYRAFSNQGGAACPFAPVDLQARLPLGGVRLETPAPTLPALAVGQETTLQLPFALAADTACGAPLGLDYVGAAAPGVMSFARSSVFAGSSGAGGSCQSTTACPAQIPNLASRQGFYYDPRRSGNGLANFIYGAVYGGVWYSALPDRSPTWYILNGDYADHLGVLPIRRFRNAAAPAGFAPQSAFVGTAWVAQVDRDTVLQAWQFDGGATGLELLDAPPQPFTHPNHSQTWYTPAESGWGLSVESLVTAPSSVLEFMVGYLYDAAGTARWVLGTDDSTSGGDAPLVVYRTHCPGCPWLVDWAQSEQPAGSLNRSYTGPTSMLFNSQIGLPAPSSGRWDRSNLPLTTIGPPAPPGE